MSEFQWADMTQLDKMRAVDAGVALFVVTPERRVKVLCEDGEMRFLDDRAAQKLFAALLA